jgi:hypothetical protein
MRASFAALLLAAAASANPAADRLAAKLERQTQALLDALVSGGREGRRHLSSLGSPALTSDRTEHGFLVRHGGALTSMLLCGSLEAPDD